MRSLNNLYLICGESGSGKDTVVDTLCEKYGFSKVQSYTTRQPRYEHEETHTFIKKEEILDYRNIVASTFFDGNYYFATQEQVDNADCYIIDKDGVESFKSRYKGNRSYKIIYITVPGFIRQLRMIKRNGLAQAIKRFANDRKAFKGMRKLCDIKFNNFDLCETVLNVYQYISEQESKS